MDNKAAESGPKGPYLLRVRNHDKLEANEFVTGNNELIELEERLRESRFQIRVLEPALKLVFVSLFPF
jgi:hypothetical protein